MLWIRSVIGWRSRAHSQSFSHSLRAPSRQNQLENPPKLQPFLHKLHLRRLELMPNLDSVIDFQKWAQASRVYSSVHQLKPQNTLTWIYFWWKKVFNNSWSGQHNGYLWLILQWQRFLNKKKRLFVNFLSARHVRSTNCEFTLV